MEFFTADGAFWLPQQADRMTPGKLTFDENGISLELADSLRGSVIRETGVIGGSPEWVTEPVVHGRLRDGREITLLQVSGLTMHVQGVQENWRADFVLTGGLVEQDAFDQALVVFDYLMPWTQPPGIADGMLGTDSFTVNTQRVTLNETTLHDGTTVCLVTGVDGQRDHASIHLDQWCAFQVTGEPNTIAGILNDWVGPLQDLLVVCLGDPVRFDDVLLRVPGGDPRAPMLQLSFAAVQPRPGSRPTAAHVEGYDAPTLLIYAKSPLPFATLIGEWFRLQARLLDVITLLCGPYYAPFMYSQHRYASTFQSAEALARATPPTREKTPSQHAARVNAVTAALQNAQLDAETIDWATNIIRSRNDKPLRQLMEELISSTGEMGRQLLAAAPDLARSVATTRTSVSHPGTRGSPGRLTRHWLGEALAWVVRVRILAELGVPVDDLSASVTQKPSFQRVLREVATSPPHPDMG